MPNPASQLNKLEAAIQQTCSYLVFVAAKVGRAHERMEHVRGRHLEWRGRIGRAGNPFEEEDRKEAQRRKADVDMQVGLFVLVVAL